MKDDKKYIKYGKLLPGLIHNLNSPLMGISGRFELLQMKFPDEKSLAQITTQIERLNEMLTTVSFLLSKESSESPTENDLKELLEQFVSFMVADKRFKHQVAKETEFEQYVIVFNVTDFINLMYHILDYLLGFIDTETIIKISNTKNIVNIEMTLKSSISNNLDIKCFIEKNTHPEVSSKFKMETHTSDNAVMIKLVLEN